MLSTFISLQNVPSPSRIVLRHCAATGVSKRRPALHLFQRHPLAEVPSPSHIVLRRCAARCMLAAARLCMFFSAARGREPSAPFSARLLHVPHQKPHKSGVCWLCVISLGSSAGVLAKYRQSLGIAGALQYLGSIAMCFRQCIRSNKVLFIRTMCSQGCL